MRRTMVAVFSIFTLGLPLVGCGDDTGSAGGGGDGSADDGADDASGSGDDTSEGGVDTRDEVCAQAAVSTAAEGVCV